MDKNDFMKAAIAAARDSIDNHGGPFGAVIVKNGRIIAKASNSVTKDNDPTAHAEVNAIRIAAKNLKTFDLSGCEIYTSCEPCPMCLGAIYWSRIDKIYYAGTKDDAKDAGFDDSFFYEELEKPKEKRSVPMFMIDREEALKVFKKWKEKEDKIEY
ncbi:MAG: nucleoside deaminase [Marinilabiliales bacterium]